MPGAVNITYQANNLMFSAPFTMTQLVMATQTRDTILAGETKPLQVRALYSNRDLNFVIGDFSPGARLVMQSSSPKLKGESMAAIQLEASDGKETQTVYVYGNYGMVGSPQSFRWEILNSGSLTGRSLNSCRSESGCMTSSWTGIPAPIAHHPTPVK